MPSYSVIIKIKDKKKPKYRHRTLHASSFLEAERMVEKIINQMPNLIFYKITRQMSFSDQKALNLMIESRQLILAMKR